MCKYVTCCLPVTVIVDLKCYTVNQRESDGSREGVDRRFGIREGFGIWIPIRVVPLPAVIVQRANLAIHSTFGFYCRSITVIVWMRTTNKETF